ncbi:MAG: CARDB domain-containing protein, partial [Candidatus Paceibacterota bacterium]
MPINCGNVKQADFKYACNQTTFKCEVDEKGTMLLEECQKQCVVKNELPDLTVEKFVTDKSKLKLNEVANITMVEKNIGKGKADQHKGNITFGDTIKEVDLSSLEPSATNTFNQITFKCNSIGVFKLFFAVDTKNTVKETEEDNNIKELEITCIKNTEEEEKEKEEEEEKEKEKNQKPPDGGEEKTPPVDAGEKNPPMEENPEDQFPKGKPFTFKSTKPD